MASNVVYLVLLTDHNDNSTTVERVFLSRDSAKEWVSQNALQSMWMFDSGGYYLLLESDGLWYVIERRNGVFERTSYIITISERTVY